MSNIRTTAIVLVVLTCCNVFASADKDPSLVAHYTFEEGPGETVKDYSGHGNHGKNLGAKYVKLPDAKGFALKFDDAQGYVDCGNNPSLDLTDALTIELWLYPQTTRIKGGNPGLVGKSLSSYMLDGEGTSCWFFVAHDSQRTDCHTLATLKTWNHIVVTFDGKFSRAYTDGRETKVQESQFSKIDHGGKFYLRYPIVYGGKVEPTVKLMMDDVRVYNRALTAAEVIAHYKQEGRARNKDLSSFKKMKLQSHSSAVAREAVLEADFSGMELAMFAPEATLQFELIEPTSAKVVAHHEITNLPKSGKTSWTVPTAKLAPGDYSFRASVADRNTKPFGASSSVAVNVTREKPAWTRAYEGQNHLNNFVTELLSVQEEQEEANKKYTFDNVRDGWVCISSTARVGDGDQVVVVVGQDEVAVHTRQTRGAIETMRYLPAGPHTLSIRSESSARLTKLVVRAIPEIIYAELGYDDPNPVLKSFGPYTWEYLEKIGLFDSVNVILQRSSRPQHEKHLDQWRSRGKKLLYYYSLNWLFSKKGVLTGDSTYDVWSTRAGLASRGFYGFMLDELSGHSHIEQYPAFTEALTRIAANKQFEDRVFYPYCTDMYESKASRAFTKVVFDAGYRLAEEKYLLEQPTEEAARIYMNEKLRLTMLRYQDYFDDCATKTIMNLGFISVPQQTQYIETGADSKVYMDMQMNLLANDPVFLGLYGVMWYHSAYADEELLRWAAKLYRHYCIEGKRERLTDDPYELPHIVNGDFEDGADQWRIESAADQSVSVERAFGYGLMQGRMTQERQGEKVLVMKRSAQGPNRISQPIKKLTPGRLYSLRMFVMDYGDFQRGKSVEKVHHFNIAIDQVEHIKSRSFREVFTNERQVRPFTGDNRLHLTFCRIVFRAKLDTAVLAISDWAGDDEPGGSIGQQTAFNFIEVQPYLED